MLIQYASSGRPPIIVNFVDYVTARNDRINIIHSEGLIETEKIIEDGCVVMMQAENDLLALGIRVVRKNGHVVSPDTYRYKVCMKIDGDTITINGESFNDLFSVFVEELPN